MAQQALVDAVRHAAGALESRVSGRLTLAAILPADSDVSDDAQHLAVLISAPWVRWENVPRVLLEFGKDLKKVLDVDLDFITSGATIERLVALPSSDPFAQEVERLYSGRWTGQGEEFTEQSIADRRVLGGHLVILRKPGPDVDVAGGFAAPEVVPFEYVDRLDSRIRDAHISDSRRQDFLTNFASDRDKSSTLREVLRSHQAFRSSNQVADFPAGCIHVLLEKGPFVEGSNWAPYGTWQIALGFERRLGNLLAALLADLPSAGSVRWNDWEDMKRVFGAGLNRTDAARPAIVFDGHPGIDAAVEMSKQNPQRWWTSGLRLPGALGEFRGSTVMRVISDRPEASRAYIIDVPRSIEMTQSPADEAGMLYRFDLNEIDRGRADELASDANVWSRNPDVTHRMRVERHLQQVDLQLCEYTNIRLIDADGIMAFTVEHQ